MSEKKPERNILLLGLVSLLNDISSEIIQPVLPIFISSLGAGATALGLIGGISDGLPSLLKLLSGCWSDRLGRRKPLVVGGYAISAIGKLLLFASSTWSQVFILKSLERCGKGIRSAPRDAMISESTGQSARGRGFGLHRAMDSTGAVVGSLLAYLLWAKGLSFSSIFLVAGILAFLALLPFMRVSESYQAPSCEIHLRPSGLSSGLYRFLIMACLFALGNFSYMFFIIRAQSLFSGSDAVAAPLLLYALFNLVYALFAMPVGIWSDRIGRRKVLFAGYALFSITALGFAFVSDIFGLIALFGQYGLVYALVDGTERAYVSDLSQKELRGSALGLYSCAIGIVSILSSLIAGFLWSWMGPQAAFLFGAGAAGLAAVGMIIMMTLDGDDDD